MHRGIDIICCMISLGGLFKDSITRFAETHMRHLNLKNRRIYLHCLFFLVLLEKEVIVRETGNVNLFHPFIQQSF